MILIYTVTSTMYFICYLGKYDAKSFTKKASWVQLRHTILGIGNQLLCNKSAFLEFENKLSVWTSYELFKRHIAILVVIELL